MPTSNMRKTSTATTTVTHVNDLGSGPRRTTSGRAVRANTNRPANYYARPFGSFSAANSADNQLQNANPQGFFPALQYFSDAITALPKEVMRQFTLMKEVEAKIHGPNEQLGGMVDELMEGPVPSRKSTQSAGASAGQGLFSFTANNSVTGSTSVSLVNGVAPTNANQFSAGNSVSGSVNGEELGQHDSEEDLVRRKKYHELRMLTHHLLANLDEKNVVLAEANRVLSQQMSRIDSVMPHIDNEISEEARLGSMTHWAYSDNRQKKQVGGIAASRRDVAATNSLAAAASAIHESEVAQARRDAVRETAKEKHKGRGKEHVDSDFDERPKKTHAKMAKSKAAQGAGLGISANGEPVKKRKVDKGLAAPAMERSASTKGAKGSKATPRDTPTGEPAKKTMKAKPAPLPAKKKGLNSANASPALASSPLHSSFNATNMEPSGNGRPQSARLRQNSTATNLRHEKFVDESGERPTSAPTKANGERMNGKRKAPDDGQEHGDGSHTRNTTERTNSLKHEDIDMMDDERAHASRSTSNSGKAGRGSKTGTPRKEHFSDAPGMSRGRSTRSLRANRDESSSEPQQGQGVGKHKRGYSNSHLIKQLAPFNRSPNMDREIDDMDEDIESLHERRRALLEEGQAEAEAEQEHSPRKRRPSSRRNTAAHLAISSPAASDRGDEDAVMDDAEPEPEDIDITQEELQEDVGASSPTRANIPDEELVEGDYDEDEDSETGDPDDPNEPKYCYCNRGSYGEMIACDNEQCPREWFHLGCTELKEPPDEEEKWYCAECKPFFVVGKGRKGGRGAKK